VFASSTGEAEVWAPAFWQAFIWSLAHDHNILVLGTNAAAAAAMKRAGAEQVGVGPYAIAETISTVDVIVASLNLLLPGAMLGEVTPEIVRTILGARAKEVLLPVNQACLEIGGGEASTLDALIAHSLSRIRFLVSSVRHI